jgi:hypothetical protein
MSETAPFSFWELGEHIHGMTVNFFAARNEGFEKKITEEGATREQVAALFMGDAIQSYTQERSATKGESANFILDPDWKYVRLMFCDLLTEIYIEKKAEYEKVAAEKDMTLHHLAASILLTHFKMYMEGGTKYEPRIGIPEKLLNEPTGLEEP